MRMTEGNWTNSPTVLGRFFEIFLERTALFSCPNYEFSVNNSKKILEVSPMSTAILMCVLFFAKVVDNALSTTKTILVQRNHSILAGIALAASNFIYLCITKNVVNSDSCLALIVVSLASGVGCCMAVAISSRLSKEKTYVNVIMSDDKEKMQAFRDFLAQHHITNTATDSYTLDWTTKSITVTAFAETNVHSRLINNYIEEHNLKCKRMIQSA